MVSTRKYNKAIHCRRWHHGKAAYLFLVVLLCFLNGTTTATQRRPSFVGVANRHQPDSDDHVPPLQWLPRGGASPSPTTKKKRTKKRSSHSSRILATEEDPFNLVARVLQDRLQNDNDDDAPEVDDIIDALKLLSSSQQTFKGLDGAAHEAYQRTHAGDDVDLSVRGRARRSAARAAATADGLGACELCELLTLPSGSSQVVNGTLLGREVVLNETVQLSKSQQQTHGGGTVSLLVLYEQAYRGGAGILHGGIEDDEKEQRKPPRGRLVVIVGDNLADNLQQTLEVIDQEPMHVRVTSGLTNEVASVHKILYETAGALLQILEPSLREYGDQTNGTVAVHFVGRSLAGGVASLAASMLHGSLPMPKGSRRSKKQSNFSAKKTTQKANVDKDRSTQTDDTVPKDINGTDTNTTATAPVPLSGLGQDRTSAVTLGAPPCVSANVPSDFVISILYGDDVLCRASRASMDRLVKRSKKAMKSKGWIGGKQLNFMSDAVSLTMSSFRTHAHGSEGEELRLSVPGRAYLLRPRRLGDLCSIHEVGNRLKGGREALRAHVLWQLDDILLSKSLWKHHQLDSYIHGLDRAHLRGFTEDGDDEEFQ